MKRQICLTSLGMLCIFLDVNCTLKSWWGLMHHQHPSCNNCIFFTYKIMWRQWCCPTHWRGCCQEKHTVKVVYLCPRCHLFEVLLFKRIGIGLCIQSSLTSLNSWGSLKVIPRAFIQYSCSFFVKLSTEPGRTVVGLNCIMPYRLFNFSNGLGKLC